MSLENIITQLALIESTIKDIRRAYDKLPESISELPCILNVPTSGAFKRRPDGIWQVDHQIKIQLLVIRADLPEADTRLRPFIERVPNKLNQNIHLNNSCNTSQVLSYFYAKIEYAKTEYLGIEYMFQVSEALTTSFSA